jgi:hypothetical protein
MKRLITGLAAALALAFVGTARADDTKASTETKTTTKKSDDGTMKTEKKATTEEKGTGGSSTETSTSSSTKTAPKAGEKAMPDTQAAPAK